MNTFPHVRLATTHDVPTLLQIKERLHVSSQHELASSGGFLLGSNAAQYTLVASLGQVLLLESCEAQQPIGFLTLLESHLLMGSPLWERRHEVRWRDDFDWEAMSRTRVAYLDQLAILPDQQRHQHGMLLGLCALEHLCATGHDQVLTTTLEAPLRNQAAMPLIERAGGERVGQLDEHYEGVGEVCSALHMIPLATYLTRREQVFHAHPEGPLAALLTEARRIAPTLRCDGACEG